MPKTVYNNEKNTKVCCCHSIQIRNVFFKLSEADLQIMMNVVTNPNYICIGLCQ